MAGNKITRFTKGQFLESDRFTSQQKDVLGVLLEDGKTYTADEVNETIKAFLEKEAD